MRAYLVQSFCALTALAVVTGTAAADDSKWPERPITVIVPYAAGGSGDSTARIAARYASEVLKQPVLIENRPGGGGMLGTEIVAKAKPDGYTFCSCGGGAITTAPFVQKNVRYNPLKDFEFVGVVQTNPQIVLVKASLPIHSVKDLIDYAKKNPGKLNYASTGVGSGMHFSVELFQSKAGVKLTHIPYTGGATATAALLSGEVDLTFTNSTDAIPYLDGHDKVRAIAVTSTKPVSFAPKLPTVAATVPGYSVLIWSGFLAPKGTPASIVNKMSEALVAMTKDEKSVAALNRVGSEAFGTTPQEFREFAKQDIDQWVGLMREIDYKP